MRQDVAPYLKPPSEVSNRWNYLSFDSPDRPVIAGQTFDGRRPATTIYEHNFGFWDIDGPVEQAFFEYIQRQSVQKTCDRCERRVRLMPPKTLWPPVSVRSNAAHPRR